MRLDKFIEHSAQKQTNVATICTTGFPNVTDLNTDTLPINTGVRRLSVSENIFTETSSARSNIRAYQISNFGLSVKNAQNEYKSIFSHDELTGADAFPVHSAGQNEWVSPTWTNPEISTFLKHIDKILFRLLEIKKLPNDWDSCGAKAISYETIERAITSLWETFSSLHRIDEEFPMPFIVPCPDGSIQLEWEENNRELEVVIPPLIDEKITVTIRDQKNVERLESFYTLENPKEIKSFLLKHDHLISTLQESHQHINRIFAESLVDVCLEYDVDPEEDYDSLFVIIKTDLSPEQSLERLNRFDMEWWLDLPYEFTSIVGTTVRSL